MVCHAGYRKNSVRYFKKSIFEMQLNRDDPLSYLIQMYLEVKKKTIKNAQTDTDILIRLSCCVSIPPLILPQR